MPIYFYWGDDEIACLGAVNNLIQTVVDPSWLEMNVTRLDGSDETQLRQALEESVIPPLSTGGRVIILRCNSFSTNYSAQIIAQLEGCANIIPNNCYLIFLSPKKPDSHSVVVMLLRKVAEERSYVLPARWNRLGQINQAKEIARTMGVSINTSVAEELSNIVQNDSIRLKKEIEKLDTYSTAKKITRESVKTLITNEIAKSETIATLLLSRQIAEAIRLIDIFLEQDEPAIKLIASLIKLVRTWLLISLLMRQGETSIERIAVVANIVNPKRVYIMQKQIKGYTCEELVDLLKQLLTIEMEIKQGMLAKEIFRDVFLIQRNS